MEFCCLVLFPLLLGLIAPFGNKIYPDTCIIYLPIVTPSENAQHLLKQDRILEKQKELNSLYFHPSLNK